ncbi:MAG: hypothetical protein CMJ94_13270 [Planctomycetes bacterium]|nr:hypothetical protein [Planctomycetota bacterium]
MQVRQRPVENRDALGLQRLMADAFADYPHCFLDVELEDPGLLAPAEAYPSLQVLEAEGRVVGCVGWAEVRPGVVELKKLYVDHALRGTGWGRRLIEWVEQQARAVGASQVELWTDTKFELAHAVYQRLGYRPSGETRPLHDISETWEYHYQKELS